LSLILPLSQHDALPILLPFEVAEFAQAVVLQIDIQHDYSARAPRRDPDVGVRPLRPPAADRGLICRCVLKAVRGPGVLCWFASLDRKSPRLNSSHGSSS